MTTHHLLMGTARWTCDAAARARARAGVATVSASGQGQASSERFLVLRRAKANLTYRVCVAALPGLAAWTR